MLIDDLRATLDVMIKALATGPGLNGVIEYAIDGETVRWSDPARLAEAIDRMEALIARVANRTPAQRTLLKRYRGIP